MRLEAGLLYGSGRTWDNLVLEPLPGVLHEEQQRVVMGALISAAWGWPKGDLFSVRAGLTSGLVQGTVYSPTCGEASYFGAPLLANVAVAWTPAMRWEIALQGVLGYVPVPLCGSNEHFSGREFVQGGKSSGMLTARVVKFF